MKRILYVLAFAMAPLVVSASGGCATSGPAPTDFGGGTRSGGSSGSGAGGGSGSTGGSGGSSGAGSSGASSSGGGSSGGGSGGATGDDSGGDDSGDDSSAGGSSGSGGGGSSGASNPCASMTTRTSCRACCQGMYPDGAATVISAIQACVCGSGSCQSMCAGDFCASSGDGGSASGDSGTGGWPVAGSACDMCVRTNVNMGGSCNMQIANACTSSDCMSYSMCFQPCSSLPDM